MLPEFYLDCVVALGTEDRWVASGFFYGHPLAGGYVVYLVTNRHVLADMKKVTLRCNPSGRRPARELEIDLVDAHDKPLWYAPRRPREDIAVVPIDFAALKRRAQQVAFFRGDQDVADRTQLRRIGVSEGDVAYVLGFPMGLIGGRRNVVVVRGGTVARIRDALAGVHLEMLVDAHVFPGNSGGPVVLGTTLTRGAWLTGVVSAYVAYEELAVSLQTQRPRMLFEENSGLAAVQLMDGVQHAIRQHLEGTTAARPMVRHQAPA